MDNKHVLPLVSREWYQLDNEQDASYFDPVAQDHLS